MEYASSIRSITLSASDAPALCDVWDKLLSCIECAPILPNVLSIAFCRISWRTLTPEPLTLISPSVRKLNFNLGDEFTWSAR